MAENLEFLLKLQMNGGNVIATVDKINVDLLKVEKTASTVNHTLNTAVNNINSKLSSLTISSVINIYDQISSRLSAATEKAEAFHQAEAQLQNTMQNTGVYSQEAFEKAVNGARELSKHVQASSADIIGMQSQIRMVGGISDDMVNKMSQAALDLAAKKNIGLQEAGNMLARSVNDPDSLMRLNRTLLIDPNVIERIQNLSKAGKTAQAQMALLAAVQQQVGGASAAAFNADPIAQFHKAIENLQLKIGNMVIDFEKTMGPALMDAFNAAVDTVGKLLAAVGWLWNKLRSGNPVIITLATVIGFLTTAIIAYNYWTKIAAFFTALWKGENDLLNLSLLANPVFWWIAVIAGVIALIVILITKIGGWGQAWQHLMNGGKLLFQAFTESIKWKWDTLINGLMLGLRLIEEGWYKFKNAVGLGNAAENNAMLAQIKADVDAREKAITDGAKKVQELGLASAKEFGAAWNSLYIKKSEAKKDGIASADVAGQGGLKPFGMGAGDSGKGTQKTNNAIATGGQRNTTVNMTISNLIAGGIKIIAANAEKGLADLQDKVINTVTRAVSIGAALGTQ